MKYTANQPPPDPLMFWTDLLKNLTTSDTKAVEDCITGEIPLRETSRLEVALIHMPAGKIRSYFIELFNKTHTKKIVA